MFFYKHELYKHGEPQIRPKFNGYFLKLNRNSKSKLTERKYAPQKAFQAYIYLIGGVGKKVEKLMLKVKHGRASNPNYICL